MGVSGSALLLGGACSALCYWRSSVEVAVYIGQEGIQDLLVGGLSREGEKSGTAAAVPAPLSSVPGDSDTLGSPLGGCTSVPGGGAGVLALLDKDSIFAFFVYLCLCLALLWVLVTWRV